MNENMPIPLLKQQNIQIYQKFKKEIGISLISPRLCITICLSKPCVLIFMVCMLLLLSEIYAEEEVQAPCCVPQCYYGQCYRRPRGVRSQYWWVIYPCQNNFFLFIIFQCITIWIWCLNYSLFFSCFQGVFGNWQKHPYFENFKNKLRIYILNVLGKDWKEMTSDKNKCFQAIMVISWMRTLPPVPQQRSQPMPCLMVAITTSSLGLGPNLVLL